MVASTGHKVPVHTMGMEEASDHVWQMLASHNRLQRSGGVPCFLNINTSKRAVSLKDYTVPVCGSSTVTSYTLAATSLTNVDNYSLRS